MPLLELRILEILSFPHFSLTCFDTMNWNFAYDFVLLYCFWSIFVGVMPLLELRILEIHSFPHFSLTCSSYMQIQIKLKFKIFNAFLLEKYYIKKPFKMFMTSVLCTVCSAQVYLILQLLHHKSWVPYSTLLNQLYGVIHFWTQVQLFLKQWQSESKHVTNKWAFISP